MDRSSKKENFQMKVAVQYFEVAQEMREFLPRVVQLVPA